MRWTLPISLLSLGLVSCESNYQVVSVSSSSTNSRISNSGYAISGVIRDNVKSDPTSSTYLTTNPASPVLSDPSGSYLVFVTKPGTYYLAFERIHYMPLSSPFPVVTITNSDVQVNAYLTPASIPSIQLTIKLSFPYAGGMNYFGASLNKDIKDIKDGDGTETITINTFSPGEYLFYLSTFPDGSATNVANIRKDPYALGNSNVTVSVYRGPSPWSTPVAVYHVPAYNGPSPGPTPNPGTGIIYVVFSIDGSTGQINDIVSPGGNGNFGYYADPPTIQSSLAGVNLPPPIYCSCHLSDVTCSPSRYGDPPNCIHIPDPQPGS